MSLTGPCRSCLFAHQPVSDVHNIMVCHQQQSSQGGGLLLQVGFDNPVRNLYEMAG